MLPSIIKYMQAQLPNMHILHSSPSSIQSPLHGASDQTSTVQVKLEASARPQAIYLNCSPSVLPFIIATTRELCHKYLDSTADTTIQGILRGVEMIGQNLVRTCGVKELIAAVLYSQYSSLIRLKLKDFSRMNQLSPKMFNRKYVAYQNILKRQARSNRLAQIDRYQNQIKIEGESCKSEQLSEKEEEENDTHQRLPSSSPSAYSQVHPLSVSSPKQAIQLIYDGLFKSSFFQQSRRSMITKMSDRCAQIPSSVYDLMTWTSSRTIKLLYAIYARLKRLGMNVGFTKYRETVSSTTGYSLKRTYAAAAEKIVRRVMTEEGDSRWNSDSGENEAIYNNE